MFYYIVGILLGLLAYLAYTLFIKPLRLRAYYIKTFQAHGYKVYTYPYQVHTLPFYEDFFKSLREKNDFNYTGKHVYSDNYDLVVSNAFNKPEITFLSQKLIKAYFDKDLQWMLPKVDMVFKLVIFMTKKGLAFIEKDVWKHRRRILSKVFTYDFISSQIPNMILTIDKMFQKFEEDYWAVNPQKRQAGEVKLDLYELISKYTSNVVIIGFLGPQLLTEKLRGNSLQEEIVVLIDRSVVLSRDLPIMIFGESYLKLGLKKEYREYLAHKNEIDDVLRVFVRKEREKSKEAKQLQRKGAKTIVELVFQEIQKEKKSQNTNQQITEDDLVDEIKTFVVAGTETTSNYLSMLLLLIHQHKQVLQELRAEIAKHIRSDQDITSENIKKITYLDCVMCEASRVFAVAEGGFSRRLQQDYIMSDILLKKGTYLNFFSSGIFHNPQIFKDPLSFKPQRWETQNEETNRLLQIVSLQFSGGPRGCIGKQLALTETKVGIIKFLMRYKNLIEPGINNRVIELKLTAHLANNEVILEKYP